VLSVLPADETVALGVVEPLHCSLFHSVALILLLDLLIGMARGAAERCELAGSALAAYNSSKLQRANLSTPRTRFQPEKVTKRTGFRYEPLMRRFRRILI